jgi:hypothetical protein
MTTTAKVTHTPGPWVITGDIVNNYFVVGRLQSDRRSFLHIALVPDAVGKGTASIVAAAPDMLEALENLENDDNYIPDHAWKMVQAAIAKARGAE